MNAALCRLPSAVAGRCQGHEAAVPAAQRRRIESVRAVVQLCSPLAVQQRNVRVHALDGQEAEPLPEGQGEDDVDDSPSGSEAVDEEEEEEEEDLDTLLGRKAEGDSVQTVLGQIGMNNVMTQPPSGEQDEEYDEDEQVITYPETPDRRITFGDLLRKAQYGEEIVEQYASVKDIEITGIQQDSRRLREGELFVAVEGHEYNGHWFLPDALKMGAALAIVRVALPATAPPPILTAEERAIDKAANPDLYDDDDDDEAAVDAETATLEELAQGGSSDEVDDDGEFDRLVASDTLHQAEAYNDEEMIPYMSALCSPDPSVEPPEGTKAEITEYAEFDAEVMEVAEAELRRLEANFGGDPKHAAFLAKMSSRVVSQAFEIDIDGLLKLSAGDPQLDELTPHPLNPLVPLELPLPLVFAQDPREFAGILAAAFYDHPSQRMITVGVTGTNGKTTTSWIMRSIFEESEHITGMLGTVEWALANERLDTMGEIWEPMEEDTTLKRDSSAPFWGAPYKGKYSVPCTTPDAIHVQRLMASMADRGATACIMEASSIGLDQGRCNEVDFDIAIFTNLTHDHLDYHITMEDYKHAKAKLFYSLSDPVRQRAVVNLDDEAAQFFADAASDVPVVTYSYDNDAADVYCRSCKMTVWDSDLVVATPLGDKHIITPLIGRHNVSNILACVAASIAINIPLDTIAKGIETAENVPGRFELIDEGQDFAVVVDYAHTPDALDVLLTTVRECGAKRIITVFGCGGDRDRSKRAYMGEIAHFKSDLVYITNDNPRSEAPDSIIQDIVSGFPKDVTDAYPGSVYNFLTDIGNVHETFETELMQRAAAAKRYVIEDRWCAIRAAIGTAQKGDVVVIAGKGHEDYQEHADVNGTLFKSWFDDRVEARNALSKLQYLNQIPGLVRKDTMWTMK